jgi:hypothetical protein
MQDDSFSGELDRRGWASPLLATVVAVVLTIIILASAPVGDLPADGSERAGYLIGYVAAATLVPWGILFLVSHRKQHPAWAIGSLIVMVLVAGIATLGRIGMESIAAAEDARVAAEVFAKASEANSADVDLGKPKGPLSEVVIDVARKLIADQTAYLGAMDRLGIRDIANPQVLARDTSGLNNCGRIDGFGPLAAQYFARTESRIAELRSLIDNSASPPAIRAKFLEGFDKGNVRHSAERQRLATLEQSALTELGAICRLLAKRRWQIEGDRFMFSSGADLNAYQSHALQLEALKREQQLIQQRSRAEMQSNLDLVRRTLPAPN